FKRESKMADWDADDFEPDDFSKAPTDKWVGEDEEGVKASWEDEDEEKPEDDAPKAIQVKKKKPLKERIAEKEEQARKAAEEKRKNEEMAKRKLNPEEMAAEKLRLKRQMEEEDLKIAVETLGISNDELKGLSSIDAMQPTTVEEFNTFKNKIVEKFNTLERSIHYHGFLDDLIRDVTVTLDADEVKKLSSTLNAVANEKVKIQKGQKGKKKSTKPKITSSKGGGELDDYSATVQYDNAYDDFM
ncbi:unnamed protein product, partial [Owenia fusiformis]